VIKSNLRPQLLSPKKRLMTFKELEARNLVIIKEAIRTGNVDQVFWFVNFRVTNPIYFNGPDDNGDERVGCWPGQQFPVVPLAWDLYGDYVGFLLRSFQESNPTDLEFYLSVTTLDRLERATPGRWYIWGELVLDRVCQRCGSIQAVNALLPVGECDCSTWRQSTDRPAGFMRVLWSFVDDTFFEVKG